MNLKRKELIISVIMLVIFLFIGLNVSVFATSNNNQFNNLILTPSTNNSTRVNMIIIEESNSTSNNSTEIVLNTVTTNNSSNNTNQPGQLANTGLEDLPWVIIAICAVSALFAYKKVKEYKMF